MADEEKTETATAKKRTDERKKGNIFQSKDFVVVFSLVIVFYSFKLLYPFIESTMKECFLFFWQLAAEMTQIGVADAQRMGINVAVIFAKAAMPLVLISALVTIVVTLAQTRLLVTFESMKPKFSRLNPLSGLKNLFSLRSLVELIKSLIKISALGYIIYSRFVKKLAEAPRLMDMEPIQAVSFLGDFIISLVLTAGAIFIFVAAGDYVYQWYDYEKKLRMSKQEVKEEYKQTEGDPQIKGKIKQKQREMAQKRMMQSVPSADVIIRNPTHYAVALAFDIEKNNAPVVLAKGTDLVALRIVKVAEEHEIPTVENRPLARGLHDGVELGREIPEQFYGPVAEILAFVYKLKKKGLDGRAQ